MPAHYSPITGVVRVYHDGTDYEHRDQFDMVCSVMWLDDTTAFLYAAHGHAGRRTLSEVVKVLAERGAKKIRLKREKTHKMPRPWQKIERDEFENTWQLTLTEANHAE
jgi:hypothetical protein